MIGGQMNQFHPYQPYPYQFNAVPTAPQFQPQQQMPVYSSQTTNTGFQKPSGVPGRVVCQEGEITAQEVPMDGSMSFFPLSDGSAIVGKRWNADGTIQTVRYIAEQPAQATVQDTTPSYVDAILGGIEDIKTQLSTARRPARKVASNES